MLPVFERLDRVLGRIERMMSASMLLIMTGLIFTNIMLRFFTGRTLSWAEDLSIFCMITMTFFAAAYGTRTNQHITMSALYDAMSGTRRMIFYGIGLLVPMVVTGCLFWLGLQVTRTIYDVRGTVPSMNLPKYLPYLIVSIAVLFMAFHFMHRVIRLLVSHQVDDVVDKEV
ncbi:TRAP transporter small permease [Candidatus Entotheonella palauensis]|uniref:Tripartite ATP-independent periplasmic transporters DctQ component domain-containing protein n=1 Tax=Candidatus Entotheonella gemina TaxID=1429439 RepID=W4M695_9BACT|nr:TRAP transporter small permease [Candidatus Entotheonella palauensis]ETX05713.1 MAG: hypothetical protein ETSY2_21380 [Candidatus Entotheonella gemina]